MGRRADLATTVTAGGCLVFTCVLSIAATLVILIGLAGMQSSCAKYQDGLAARAADVSYAVAEEAEEVAQAAEAADAQAAAAAAAPHSTRRLAQEGGDLTLGGGDPTPPADGAADPTTTDSQEGDNFGDYAGEEDPAEPAYGEPAASQPLTGLDSSQPVASESTAAGSETESSSGDSVGAAAASTAEPGPSGEAAQQPANADSGSAESGSGAALTTQQQPGAVEGGAAPEAAGAAGSESQQPAEGSGESSAAAAGTDSQQPAEGASQSSAGSEAGAGEAASSAGTEGAATTTGSEAGAGEAASSTGNEGTAATTGSEAGGASEGTESGTEEGTSADAEYAASQQQAAAQQAQQGQLNEVPMTEGMHNMTEFVKNVTEATQTKLSTFLSELAHSQGFASCARTYSLHWWAWVCQLAIITSYGVIIVSGRCMLAAGQPLLLFTATVVVIDMIICNELVETKEFEGDNGSTWANVVLGGFIMACICNYLYLFTAPSYMQARKRIGKGAPEERQPLTHGSSGSSSDDGEGVLGAARA